MGDLLARIQRPSDLKELRPEELVRLAEELRSAIVDHLSETGGHFASNLGAVDLIVALHAVYDPPRDRLVFDVGHQCYAHKMLTGRLADFPTLRQYGGISGFLRMDESVYDAFGAGHASTSISAAYGFAMARDLSGGDESVVAIIGDAGMTGGLAFEGLNNAGHSGRKFTVVLNDNAMSIAPNVGALARYLALLRTTDWYQHLERRTQGVLRRLPAGDVAARAADGLFKHSITNLIAPERTGVMFEQMGFQYIGPLDGHDLPLLLDVFQQVRRMDGPVLVHLITVKGKGYDLAEENARKYHAVTPFEPATGQVHSPAGGATFTSVFADTLVSLAEADPDLVGITAAMPDGTGIAKLHSRFPDRAVDTGIAEGHAVCFAAGLAAAGKRPVVAIYSTFLQRAYDMILHDVALQRLPVLFAIDRAGLVGEDGGTHHGAFDLTYLRPVPGLTLMAPSDGPELAAMLRFAHDHVRSPDASPIAIRYPRGSTVEPDGAPAPTPIRMGKAEVITTGDDAAIIAIGSMVPIATRAASILEAEGVHVAVVNARFVKPIDEETIVEIAIRTPRLLVAEENTCIGGFGDAVREVLMRAALSDVTVRHMALPDRFVEHGTQATLRGLCRLTAEDFAAEIREMLRTRAGNTPADRSLATAQVHAPS
ncbi:MAG: 1-deoxy-D-xylulose-5-phosphate synthase [Chthonomonadales bacterium]|nr:1-deoxy-D-xylulose-5-phosphate synthase [Chthonomonadales bacterium]